MKPCLNSWGQYGPKGSRREETRTYRKRRYDEWWDDDDDDDDDHDDDDDDDDDDDNGDDGDDGDDGGDGGDDDDDDDDRSGDGDGDQNERWMTTKMIMKMVMYDDWCRWNIMCPRFGAFFTVAGDLPQCWHLSDNQENNVNEI